MRRLELLAGATALALATSVPARAQSSVTLRIGTVPQDSGSQCFYGRDTGIFAKHGIDSAVEAMSSGPAVAAAVLSGSLDIGFSNVFSLEAAHDKGLQFTWIAPASVYDDAAPTSLLVVPKDSTVQTARDLNGKTVSTNGLRNIGEWGPSVWIDRNGGDSSTVKFVEIPVPETPAAIQSHRIDASLVTEPNCNTVKPYTRVLAKCYTAIAPRFLIGAWFVTQSWAAAHPDALKRFVEAMRETSRWANAHQTESADMLARNLKLDPSVMRGAVRARFGETFSADLIQPTIDVSIRYKVIAKSVSPIDLIYKGLLKD